jgi:multicomponent Na+:H+ antiporter subunit E
MRILAITAWCLLVWEVLVWTATLEQQLVGLGVSIVAAVAFAGFGEVPGPWLVLSPRRLWALARLAGRCAVGIVTANLSLARRIWSLSRPLSSGMVVVPTRVDTDGGLAAVGLLSSLIVDNQIVDLDRNVHQLQYHAVAVPAGTPAEKRQHINGPVEDRVEPLLRRKATR